MELDRDIHRARDLEDRRRDIAVERDLAIRIVVREDEIVLPACGHDAPQILARGDGGRRIVRIVQIDELRALQHIRGNLVQLEQEIGARRQVVEKRFGVGENRPALVDGVARHRHDRDVTGIQQGGPQVRDPFL